MEVKVTHGGTVYEVAGSDWQGPDSDGSNDKLKITNVNRSTAGIEHVTGNAILEYNGFAYNVNIIGITNTGTTVTIKYNKL